MSAFRFSKYSGAGNDFILVDNRLSIFPDEAAPFVCDRHEGVGGDGVLLWEHSSVADARMRLLNRDGSEGEMCGNGLRCFITFLEREGVIRDRYTIETGAGLHYGEIEGEEVRTFFPHPPEPIACEEGVLLNTGVPHLVTFDEQLTLEADGKRLRAKYNANVNFAQVRGGSVHVRTYERGVEGETLACGTGSLAAAFASSLPSPVDVQVRSGAHFEIMLGEELSLKGPAHFCFEGKAPIGYTSPTYACKKN